VSIIANSKQSTVVRKPREDFPLFPHATGRWAKKVRGTLHYFGKTADDPTGEAAERLWQEQKDDLYAGRVPRRRRDEGATLADIINGFLEFKEQRVQSGELAPRTFEGYKEVGKMLAAYFGRDRRADDLRSDDFQELRASMAKRWGPVALGNRIQVVRSIFRWGYESERLDTPVRFGPGFKKPSAKVMRQARLANGPKMFLPEQIKALLAVASPGMKAMILLAINGGLGNADLGAMTEPVLDLKNEWLNYPRAKTAIPRRIPLWPETIEAVKLAIASRPQPKDEASTKLVFIGARGQAYYRGWRIAAEFADLCKKAKVEGRHFYDLRRTFQTIGEGCRDLVAVQSIMGHAAASGDMSAIYRQTVEDERLKAVVCRVHDWLWPKPATKSTSPSPKRRPKSKRKTQAEQSEPLRIVG
jgi:integrase